MQGCRVASIPTQYVMETEWKFSVQVAFLPFADFFFYRIACGIILSYLTTLHLIISKLTLVLSPVRHNLTRTSTCAIIG